MFFLTREAVQRGKIFSLSIKGTGGHPPEDFLMQLDWVKSLTGVLGHFWYEMDNWEADDLIASAVDLRRTESKIIIIVSSDKDLAQLIDKDVNQLLPPPTANPRLGWKLLDEVGVFNKFSVNPGQIVDYLSIIGDQSDNIPGIRGVGPKTASKWIQNYGTLEGLIENAGRLNPKRFCSIVYENRDLLMKNRELITLNRDLEFEIPSTKAPNLLKLEEILLEMEMKKSWEEAQKRYDS